MKTKKRSYSILSYLVAICLVFFSFSSFAQTSTIFSGNWNVGGNWSNNVPINSSTAFINHAINLNVDISINGGTYTINESGTITYVNYEKIDIDGTGVLDVDGNVTIQSDFTIRNFGQLIVRSYDTLIVGDTEFRNSALIVIEKFGVMIINGNLSLRNNNNTTLDGNIFVNGNVEARNNSVIVGSGQLQATGDVDLNNSTDFFGSTTGCSNPPCTYGGGGGLPVELLSFTGKYSEAGFVNLEWITESEINSDYFTVEVSTDGFVFRKIGTVDAAGNSIVQNKYNLTVPSEKATTYYRLTEVAVSGIRKTYPAIVLEAQKSASERLVFYPNPTKGSDFLYLESKKSNNTDLVEVRDMSGRLVFSGPITENHTQVPIKGLKSGLYFLIIKGESATTTEKLIIN